MADPDLGWTDLGVRPDASGFGTSLDRQLSTQMTGAGRSAASRFSAGFRRAATVGIAGGGLLALKIGKDSIDQASSLNESLNAVNVTYEKQAAAVKALGREAADSLGLSNVEFNGLSVRFAGFAEQVAGGAGPRVVSTLDDLTTRAADFASVMNLEVAEAANLFQSGLAGETEPLRRYGLDLSAAAVQAHAYKSGLAEVGAELTEQQKVQARYSLLMQQTAKTQGDFANTSDSLANQQRILNARWDDAKAKLGETLLPILEDFTQFLVEDGLPAVERFGEWFSETGAPAIRDFADDVKPAVGAVKDLVGFLADLPSEAKVAGLVALAGGIGAAKLRGGGGALGAAGSALGLAKPVPVFVTNQGFGGGKPGAPGVGGVTAGLMSTAGTLLGAEALRRSLQADGGPLDDAASRAAARNIGLGSFLAFNADDIRARGEDYGSTFGQAFKLAALKGLPGTKAAVRDLLAEYDKTPSRKQTTFEILGYDVTLDRIDRIGRAADYAARDRRMRIAVEYADQGYETRGGLQRGGGTVSTNTGRALGGYE